ncbi:MAG: aspartate aminotransferase family protein [Treponema porcinum]|uniref:aspartate aminotransferase family protein n=1 Tax=Treponema porcinum TaxID=261392 RepID=UPI002A8108B5|nr:aspartate aminotransferase family protein [Treponema porcinum]MDY5048237.1 aspartate aminotransferase family protein [Treponema porcinum]
MLKDELPCIITKELPGPKAAHVIKRRAASVPDAIRCIYPCVIEKAQGAIIEDPDGNRFLDWVGGVGVLNVGHSHPALVKAVQEQAEKYFHGMFNIVTHEGYVSLAEKLGARVPVRGEHNKVMFANSGAEADENAVKIAKAFTGRSNIIVMSGAFHGRTLLTMAMTSKKAYAKGQGQLPGGIFRAEFPYLYRRPEGMSEAGAIPYYVKKFTDVFEECAEASSIAAVVIEPVQGEGGFIPAPIEYVQAIRKICDENGILLVADEVQCGFGRSGKLFASEYWKEAGCAPDIIASAKSIAGGVPLSAVIARDEIMDSVPGGVIGGTYGGNALACAAGLKVLDVIDEEKLLDRANEIGAKCLSRFSEWKEKYECVGDVRGLGAMIGIEFVKNKASKEPAPQLVSSIIQYAASRGLLMENAGTYNNVIRFLAPLVMTDAQLEAGLNIYEEAIAHCSK